MNRTGDDDRDAYLLWVLTPRGARPQIIYADRGETPIVGRSTSVQAKMLLPGDMRKKTLDDIARSLPAHIEQSR